MFDEIRMICNGKDVELLSLVGGGWGEGFRSIDKP
jgi:hypothetical protein